MRPWAKVVLVGGLALAVVVAGVVAYRAWRAPRVLEHHGVVALVDGRRLISDVTSTTTSGALSLVHDRCWGFTPDGKRARPFLVIWPTGSTLADDGASLRTGDATLRAGSSVRLHVVFRVDDVASADVVDPTKVPLECASTRTLLVDRVEPLG